MKAMIDLGISILLLGLVTHNLPAILRNVRKGQLLILEQSAASNWGKAWVPKAIN